MKLNSFELTKDPASQFLIEFQFLKEKSDKPGAGEYAWVGRGAKRAHVLPLNCTTLLVQKLLASVTPPTSPQPLPSERERESVRLHFSALDVNVEI